jgi:sialidase-1
MTVRLSTDDGKTWPISRVVNPGPSAYSCLTVLPDGTIGLLYEQGKQDAAEKISFVRFNLEWLTNAP